MVSKPSLLNRITNFAELGPLRQPYLIGTTLAKDMLHRDLFKQASAMAYVTLLSLIPSLVAIFCVLSLFSPLMSGGNFIGTIRDFILKNLASGTGESAVAYLDNMIKSLDLATIGWSSFSSVLVTLILLLRQIEEALNRIWLITKGRNVFTRFMYFWTFLTLGIVVLATTVGMSAGFNFKKYLSVTTAQAESNTALSFLLAYCGSFLFFFFMYKVVPNCRVQSRNAAAGAAASGLILGLAGWGYGLFVGNSGNYQTIYGALAALPLFLTWLYICWIIILFGAVLSWRIQEGFPSSAAATGSSGLEVTQDTTEQWRNLQLKTMLPKIALLATYKNFQHGSGKGISPQDLGHQLNLPVDWIRAAMDTLASMGFVVSSQPAVTDLLALDINSTESFFPAFPADKLDLRRINQTLETPRDEWIQTWLPDLPEDLKGMLASITTETAAQDPAATVAVILAQ